MPSERSCGRRWRAVLTARLLEPRSLGSRWVEPVGMAVVGDHVGVAWVSDSMEPKQGRLLGRSSRPSPGRSVDEAAMTIVDVAVDYNIGVVANMDAYVWLGVGAVVVVEH